MDHLKAVVQKIIPEGKHGPCAIATSQRLEGSVTFSLEPQFGKKRNGRKKACVSFWQT